MSEKYNWIIADTFDSLRAHIRLRPFDPDNARYDGKCNVVVFEVFDLAEDNDRELKFQRKNSSFSPNPVDTADEAETLVAGTIRFDGCSHMNFGDKNGYIHGCGKQEMIRFGQIFEHLFDAAEELMGRDLS